MAVVSTFPFQAARDGDLVAINSWRASARTHTVANPVDLPIRFDDWRPLQLATAEGDECAVRTLLSAGATPEALTPSRCKACQTALHVAARYGHVSICRLLVVEGKVDPNQLDNQGFSPLHYAVAGNHLRTVKELIHLGARPEASSARSSPVNVARAKGFSHIADVLSARAASVKTTESDHAQLRAWLQVIGCDAYFNNIVQAGYDFSLIKEQGFSEADIRAIGIPPDKKGHEKKLLTKHKFPHAQTSTGEEEEEEEEEEEDDEDDDDEDESEEDEDDDEDDEYDS